MNAKQQKITSDAIERLNEIRSKVASKTGDIKELRKEYRDLVSEVKGRLSDILHPMENSNERYWQKHNKVNIKNIPVCGTLERQPELDAGDKIVADTESNVIKQIIKNNKINYADLHEMTNESMRGSGGSGDMGYEIEPSNVGIPKWVKELQSDLRVFRGRQKTKEDYDFESMVRGLPRKQKAKKNLREKSLFILLDTSGSMFGRSSRGHSIIELVAGYILPIAKKFSGELWFVDSGDASEKVSLKIIRKDQVKNHKPVLNVVGGGATVFDDALKDLNDTKERFRQKQGDTDFMTVFLTDADTTWTESLLPTNLIIVTVPEGQRYLPFLDPKKNQRAIIAQVD